MKAASLNDLKKELKSTEVNGLREIVLRLGKYKKENKELITYLLFDADDEHSYVQSIKSDMDDLFTDIHTANLYYAKKNLRKILRFVNRQIRYSGIKETEIELRIYFCSKMKASGIRFHTSQILLNVYNGQLKKIHSVLSKLPEDLQYDYVRPIAELES